MYIQKYEWQRNEYNFFVREKKRDCAPNAFSGKELKIRKINLTATVYLNEVTKKTRNKSGTQKMR